MSDSSWRFSSSSKSRVSCSNAPVWRRAPRARGRAAARGFRADPSPRARRAGGASRSRRRRVLLRGARAEAAAPQRPVCWIKELALESRQAAVGRRRPSEFEKFERSLRRPARRLRADPSRRSDRSSARRRHQLLVQPLGALAVERQTAEQEHARDRVRRLARQARERS